jgi:hypothetical protein
MKKANVPVGSLPAGESFKGVWYNPVWGELHMLPEGSTVQAKWKSSKGGVWGALHGNIDGDVIKFEWEEHKTGAVGPGSTRKGKGYFKFQPQEPPNLPRLKGEWGLGENEVGGGEWDCVKQKDLEPNLKEIGGEPDPTVDTGWDQEKKK